MRELSPSGGSERYGVCDDEGRGLPDAPSATSVGPLCPLCRRRGGSQTRPSYLYPLVPIGEGLAPSRRFCTTLFDLRKFRRSGGEPLLERSKRGEKIAGGLFRWAGHIHIKMDVACP